MKNFTVSVVVPNFNGESLIAKNLPVLLKTWENRKNNILEVIIVDDGSKDSSINLIKSSFPQVKLIKHKVNRGFSATVNTGVRSAKGDLLLILNTDVLPEHDFLVSTFKHFENSKTFAVSLHEKGYGAAKGSFSEGYIKLGMSTEKKTPLPSFYVSGGSGVFRRKYWLKLGGLDERLLSPFYWEDIDLCYRAWKRGYECYWEPDGIVIHTHESTVGRLPKGYVTRIKERNRLVMLWKNIHSKPLIRKHIAGLMLRTIKHPGYLRIILMAVMKSGAIVKARRREAKLSILSDEAVFDKFHEK